MLPLDIFKTIIASTPLISIDLILRNNDGHILLGKRNNRPAQGYWFVPGGRILKDETFESAITRLANQELGLDKLEAKFKGIYQHFYDDNLTNCKFSTHYVVLAYEMKFNSGLTSLPTLQHARYKWFTEKDLLSNSEVHKHTKWYFQRNTEADNLYK